MKDKENGKIGITLNEDSYELSLLVESKVDEERGYFSKPTKERIRRHTPRLYSSSSQTRPFCSYNPETMNQISKKMEKSEQLSMKIVARYRYS